MVRPEQVLARAAEVADDVRLRGHQLFFAQADVLTAYCSDEVAAPRWIAQFFAGHLGESEARRPDATVVSTGDPELFAALRELAPGTGDGPAEVPLTDAVTLVRRSAGKVTPPEDVYLLLLPEDRTIVLVTSGNPEVCREEGMQTLRALSKWLLIERGWIPMHSACAAKDGRTICVSGPKASGKTSTLLNLLARNGCDLVAVDKFLVRDGGGRLDVCGIPGKIGIRVGSAVVQPAVLDWLSGRTTPFFPHISRAEVEHIAATSSPAQRAPAARRST